MGDKIIHYCWFGYGELSEEAKRTLASWDRYAPGFEVRRCDESVFDVNSCEWTKMAYKAKKYAFVADYARFRMIYDYGGVYMDLGSELIKDITPLVEACSPLSAIEEMSTTVSPGLIVATSPHNRVVASVLSRYETMDFRDDPEFLASNTVNEVFTAELKKIGFMRENRMQRVGDWTLLPSSAFNPVYGFGGYHVKKDTYSVHHYSGSWTEPKFQIKKQLVRQLSPFLGRRVAQIIGRIVGELKQEGFAGGFRKLISVATQVLDREKRHG